MVQFKLGAFSPGCPVQPAVVRYRFDDHDPSFTFPLSSVGYLWGLLTQMANHMEVEYLDVYTPSEEEKKNPALFAANVRRVMAQALGVETTKHASEDCALCIAAQKYGLPLDTGVIAWEAVSESLVNFRVRDAMAVLKDFASIDKSGTGRIDFETFETAMRTKAHEAQRNSLRFSMSNATWDRTYQTPHSTWPTGAYRNRQSMSSAASVVSTKQAELSTEELRSIFNLLDTSGEGYLDFKDYLCGVAVLNGHGQNEFRDVLKMTFDSLAQGQANFEKADLDRILLRAAPGLERERLTELFNEADKDNKGIVSREQFISFFLEHQEDLPVHAAKLFPGLRGLRQVSANSA